MRNVKFYIESEFIGGIKVTKDIRLCFRNGDKAMGINVIK